jgi:Domain of Unknown Function with PDB structure (DUF3857)
MIEMRQGDCRVSVEMVRCFRLRWVSWIFLATVWALAAMAGQAAEAAQTVAAAPAPPAVQPPSKWVAPRSFDRPPANDPADPSQDYRWLLSDRQINAQNDEEFLHQVQQPLTAAGVQYVSHIPVNYDPVCQSLTFHWARIWRGTNKLDRLDASKLHVNEVGRNEREWLFGSRKTAILLMDDVREGDIVDYAYTIEGRNPALGGKFCDTVQLQFKEPVDRAVTRLVWPFGRRLYLTNHLTSIQPTVVRKTNVVEFTWDVRKAPGLRLEPMTPADYDPYPWVQLSEFQGWPDVNRWALRIFTTTNALSAELARKINEWKPLAEPADRVVAALSYVQQEIRAPGTGDSPDGFELPLPSAVFARRFGDDKAKSVLLTAMLRALRIEAFPVLVHDRLGQELAQLHPSPILFNHVVVQVNLDGQSFWLDPTAVYQRGLLMQRWWPSYSSGLTLSPSVAGLTTIPLCPVQPLTTMTEYLNVTGLNLESTAKIITVAEGPDADLLRQHLATTPREDLERDNLNALAKFYPFVRRTGPLVYSDDQQQNRIEVTESYAIEKLWSRLPDESNFHFRIYALNFNGIVANPAASVRTMPLAVPYPVHQIFHAEVNVTSSLPAESENVTIDHPAFYFRRTAAIVGGNLILNFEYRSWGDAVAPNAVPGYVHDLIAVSDSLAYTVIGLW